GARVVLEFPSVGATENLMCAAVLAKGTTVLENAAREPEVTDLAAFLDRMGGQVVGAGTSTIEIEGVEQLSPADSAIICDRVEAGTLLMACGITGGELERMGADVRTEGRHAIVRGVERLSGAPVRASDVRAGAALVLAGLVADGETVVFDCEHVERGYPDLPAQLRALGADIDRLE